MNVSTRQLKAFLEVARLQSFTRAADRIYLSQAGLSMMIRELEGQLGSRLFERTTRSVSLTDAGRRLLPVAQRVVEELGTVAAEVGQARALATSVLRVAATPLLSSSLLPSVIRTFAQSHPSVAVTLTDCDVADVARRVVGGDADIGFGFFFKPEVGMVRSPLFRFRLMRIRSAGAGDPGLGGTVPWSSLKQVPLIGLPPENPIQSLIERHLAPMGRAHEDRPVFNLFGTIIGMVESGIGQAVIPSFALGDCLRHRVRVDMLVRPTVHINLYVGTRRGAEPKPAATAFAGALQQAIPTIVMRN